MTDKELLALAAKAIGLDGCTVKVGRKNWNPLKDDGHALRLAVRLAIDFYEGEDGGPHAYAGYFVGAGQRFAVEPHGADAFAATRRAITRAAAEIAKSR
ncbi:MAG: hypothetical protein JWR74_2008 [Polaromonas sp.]|nr:hypothetical protein [Polaromonas sp.]